MIITVNIIETGFKQGFFNVAKSDEHFFGKDGEKIDAVLGKNSLIVESGIIDRKNVPSGAPRIRRFGKQYSLWIHANFHIGDKMLVEIVSPNKIILYRKGESHQ